MLDENRSIEPKHGNNDGNLLENGPAGMEASNQDFDNAIDSPSLSLADLNLFPYHYLSIPATPSVVALLQYGQCHIYQVLAPS